MKNSPVLNDMLGMLLIYVNLIIYDYLCLQTARFRQFWDEAAKSRHILDVVPGIYD